MNSKRSIGLTVSLIPLFLISLFFSFGGTIMFLGLIGSLLGARASVSYELIFMGIVAFPALCSTVGAFRMKLWGVYGLAAVAVLLLCIAPFVRWGTLPLVGLLALPVAVAYGLKDVENMD